jgi:hypothetical protein
MYKQIWLGHFKDKLSFRELAGLHSVSSTYIGKICKKKPWWMVGPFLREDRVKKTDLEKVAREINKSVDEVTSNESSDVKV